MVGSKAVAPARLVNKLRYFARHGEEDVVEHLVCKSFFLLESSDGEGRTVVFCAAEQGQLSIVVLLHHVVRGVLCSAAMVITNSCEPPSIRSPVRTPPSASSKEYTNTSKRNSTLRVVTHNIFLDLVRLSF
jgi:hypothetical protein